MENININSVGQPLAVLVWLAYPCLHSITDQSLYLREVDNYFTKLLCLLGSATEVIVGFLPKPRVFYLALTIFAYYSR